MKLPVASAGDKKAGFTLIEVLIVLGILLIIFSVGGPISFNFYLDYQLDAENNLLLSILRHARNLSMVNHNESDHGLYIKTDEFVIFQGASYATRVASQDRGFPRAAVIAATGPAEIIFSSLSGAASASSTYSLNDGRRTRDIFVNSEGLVYEP